MQNLGIKILLNRSVLGDGVVVAERRFARIDAGYLQAPEHHAKYFETLPTAWSVAYLFQRAIEQGQPAELEEWVALLLLYSYRAIHLNSFAGPKLQQHYDRDLWPALSGTYPSPRRAALADVKLLQTDQRVIVGGYYPGVIFFPARARAAWVQDGNLVQYLDASRQRFSLQQCFDLLLPDETQRRRFHLRLRSVAELLEQQTRRALLDFCAQMRGAQEGQTLERLAADPAEWPPLGDIQAVDDPHGIQTELLKQYPLKQTRNGGTAYYLVGGWPTLADWMTKQISPGAPAPNHYEWHSPTQIKVKFRGQEHLCPLGEKDEVVLLRELFIEPDRPFYCALDKTLADERTEQVRRLHRQEITNNFGPFSNLKSNDLALCLAPVKSALVQHFPELLKEPERYAGVRGRTAEGGLEWEFTLRGYKFLWPTEPKIYKALTDTSLAVWPPRVAPQWNLYVAHGMGARKETCGRWLLVNEAGQPGENVELGEDEYINVLAQPGQPNSPLALLLCDSAEQERGLFFLATPELQPPATMTASLAMDFGTSNSSLAFKVDGPPQPLLFTLTPKMLWGAQPKLENPGFVPFNWGGQKGYFPTILLKRQAVNLDGVKASKLEARHLFAVDIPGLHKEMETRLFDGTLARDWPEIHKNLKWEHDPQMPWRRPAFLGLVLLYAHAELFFRYCARPKDYVFTFPLAFSQTERDGFHGETKQVLERTRLACFGKDEGSNYIEDVDESTAIARSVNAASNKAMIEVFIDIGGGTTDIAIRHDGKFLVLDSVKLAGKSFFQFAQHNFEPGVEAAGSKTFKQHLGKLLVGDDSERYITDLLQLVKGKNVDLGTFYSLMINRLDDQEFKSKEAFILEKGMGWPSYQMYRTELFFRHILAYALLQACAVAVEQRLDAETLKNGIKLILSGNGWGLMLFGEFKRLKSQLKGDCEDILAKLKEQLLKAYDGTPLADEEQQRLRAHERACLANLKIADLDLLNEKNLSLAKTQVPVGALTDLGRHRAAGSGETTAPYAGITMRGLSFNGQPPIEVRWCERWSFEAFRRRPGVNMRAAESLSVSAPENYETPLDPQLAVFTILGGSAGHDPLPGEEWIKINNSLCDGHAYLEGNKLARAPINQFLSQVLYPDEKRHVALEELAVHNKTLK